jgi:hypothetical protein
LYLPFVATVPLVCSDWFLVKRTAPLAETSSFWQAVPWMPETTVVVPVYLAVWVGIQVVIQVLLWRHRRSVQTQSVSAAANTRTMQLGMLPAPVAVAVDLLLVVFWGFQGVSMIPLGTLLMGIILASGLISHRLNLSEDPPRGAPRGLSGPAQ